MKKSFIRLMAVLTLSSVYAVTALAGWEQKGAEWYYSDPDSGERATGWTQIDGSWYYLEPENDGLMHRYWLDLGNKRYYMNENGVMQTGVFYVSDALTGSRFAYQADENGVLIRNTTKENGTKTILYDQNGIMKYRNNTTRQVSHADGGTTWQYVLNESDMLSQQDSNKQSVSNAVKNLKDNLYDDYKDRLKENRSDRITRWEERVKSELGVFLTQEECMAFITQVKAGRFCKFSDRESGRSDEWYDEFYSEYDDSHTDNDQQTADDEYEDEGYYSDYEDEDSYSDYENSDD